MTHASSGRLHFIKRSGHLILFIHRVDLFGRILFMDSFGVLILLPRAESAVFTLREMRGSMEHPWLNWWLICTPLRLRCETLSTSVSWVLELYILCTRGEL